MHRDISGSRLVVIEGAGHVSNLERPAEFNRALEDFLKGIES
jgi:pimeloyl-ACP methyl ester carboxylesterase